MSRVHDALRRAGHTGTPPPPAGNQNYVSRDARAAASSVLETRTPLKGLLDQVQEIPFHTIPDSLLIDPSRSHDAPSEEFRTLRTRLNHLQGQQGLHTLVVTSPSPAEGKSFAAANLAIAQAHAAALAEQLQQLFLPRTQNQFCSRRRDRELPHPLPHPLQRLLQTLGAILQPRSQVVALAPHGIQRRVIARRSSQ